MNPRQADQAYANRNQVSDVASRRLPLGQQAVTNPVSYGSANNAPTPSRNTGNTSAPAPTTQTPTTQTQQRAAVGPWQDAAYNAQIASIERALQDYETGATTRGERYGIDYGTGLQKLGYRPQEGFNAIDIQSIFEPAAAAKAAPMALSSGEAPAGVGIRGQFDIEGQYDPYSAAAQGTRSRRDDFAARGTLRSSDFAKNFGEFQQRLNEQLQAMETGRGRFAEDLATDVAQQRASANERRQSAQRDAQNRAIMRAIQESGF
jgi:hypothetical protein